MTKQIRLGDFSTAPLYNIKAVVQATDISSSTLRAWERRYQMCSPQRSESGYRLYSDRDIAKIRWLKDQVDAGMSISQAVAWLERLTNDTGDEAGVVLPFHGEPRTPNSTPPASRTALRNVESFREELLQNLLDYNEASAEKTLSEAFALYSVEEVGEEIFVPLLVRVGELWHSGQLSITNEHYVTNYLMQRLMTLLHASTRTADGPVIWVGCAPGELHEMGALLLAIFLRRAGYYVHYLGRNLASHDLVSEIERQKPTMILLSATTVEAAANLAATTEALVRTTSPRPIVGYGGRIFNQSPDLRNDIPGIFLGETAQEAIGMVDELLKRVEWQK